MKSPKQSYEVEYEITAPDGSCEEFSGVVWARDSYEATQKAEKLYPNATIIGIELYP
jgi:hypothetical protein